MTEPLLPPPAPQREGRAGGLAAVVFLVVSVGVSFSPDRLLALLGAPGGAVRFVRSEVVDAGRIIDDTALGVRTVGSLGLELYATLYQAVLGTVAALYLARRRPGAFSVDRRALAMVVRTGALMGGALVVLGAVLGLVTARVEGGAPLRALMDGLDSPPLARPSGRLLFLASMLLLAPLEEETVFRGIVLGALRRRLAAGPAAIVQAGLFAACHAVAGLPSAVVVLTYFWGLVAAYLVERTGSVGACVLLHSLGNALGVVVIALVMGREAWIYALFGGS